ncbi:hypothetical protein [Kitasatospora phosalacinea]|uniref:PEGA domain-containing protein n=1 Tax=Kitasatospora phosalacinea TaxID=2065 RepID=A0ABW6GUX5_9ACTN
MGDGKNGTLTVEVAGRGRGKFRVHAGRTVLDRARTGHRTSFVLAPGPHRIQLRQGLDRSNTVTVDVPADGRVRVGARRTWYEALLSLPPLLSLVLDRGRPLLGLLPLPAAAAVPGVTVRLRVVEP